MKNKLVILIFIIIFLVGTLSYSLGLFSVGGTQVSSLEKGLVAHYPLDGESGTKDITPNANHGTNNGATLSTGRKGEANGSYNFDGVNDYISLPCSENDELDLRTELSMSAWVYATSFKNYNYIISKNLNSGYANQQYSLATSNNIPIITIGGTYITSSTTLSLNTWYLLTATLINGTLKFYLNGQYIEQLDVSGTTVGFKPNMNIGTRSDGIGTIYYWDGSISDVRIYNRALEEDEIKLLYDSFKPEIATSDLNKGLVGHWMLDSENGAKDLTPNGNHGTANGGITIGGTTDRKGKTGGATEFDGVNDYILLNELNTIKSYSLWVNADNLATQVIFTNYQTSSGLGFWSTYNSLILKSGSLGFRTALLPAGYSAGQWNHIVVNYDESGIPSCYVNGVETSYGSNNYWTESDNPYLQLGRRTTGNNFIGKLADFRIYNRALSTDEIKLLYDQYKPKEASIGSLQKGLVLDMPLTTKHMKSATVVSDRTPYGNDGTVSGATVGSDSTSFDGVNDYVEVVNNNIISKTICAWVKFTSSTSIRGIIFNNQGNYHMLSTSNSGNRFATIPDKLSSSGRKTVNAYNDGVWHFVVALRDSNEIYVDGIKVETEVDSNNYSAVDIDKLVIGRRSSSYYFDGEISGVKIYNRALSADEIKLLYEKGRS